MLFLGHPICELVCAVGWTIDRRAVLLCSLMASHAGAAATPLWQSCETQQDDVTSVKILHYGCFPKVCNSYSCAHTLIEYHIQGESTIRVASVFIFIMLLRMESGFLEGHECLYRTYRSKRSRFSQILEVAGSIPAGVLSILTEVCEL